MQAAEHSFSITEVKGCFVQFGQALNQRISTLGLLLFIYSYNQLLCLFDLYELYSLGTAIVTAPNLPRVDEFCNIL